MTDDTIVTDDMADETIAEEVSVEEVSTEEVSTVDETEEVAVEEVSTVDVGEASQGKDKDFVEYVVKQLVDNPAEVQINRKVDELGVFITVSVAKDDMGKLIGKSGQTVDALRVLLRVIGAKENNRVNLKVVEPGEL